MGSAIKMICPNQSCINKSIVFRKFSTTKEQRCHKCDWLLVVAKENTNKKDIKFNERAKRELKELGAD